ncbi:MAG TPA: hypothetical protein VFM46_14310 [Pseudomonadales bacterium]|nr:hypothetical protein [Pseudomonadales bacterium]
MGMLLLLGLIGVVFVIVMTRAKRHRVSHKTEVRRQIYIDSYPFPSRISDKLKTAYPNLSSAQIKRVIEGLRQYFQLCRMAKKQNVAMPSQAVDVAWHEFILFTQDYEIFCKRAFGHFLHHTPAQAMKSKTAAQAGIKRAWRLACKLESLDPKTPVRLPLIFALDAELSIPDGFYYRLDCQTNAGAPKAGNSRPEFCVTSIGCSSCSSCSSGSGEGLVIGSLFGSWFGSDSADANDGASADASDSSSDSGSSCSSGCSSCGGGD